MKEIDLKPCPFCGNEEIHIHTVHFNDEFRKCYVFCAECGAKQRPILTRDDAEKRVVAEILAARWNKRIGEPDNGH